jgi:mono/diheme cytochrome c family protein
VRKRYVRWTTSISSAFLLTQFALAAPPSKAIARGEYLVKNVAMCGDCHSARDEHGQIIESKWLQGQVLPFKATVPMPWADRSPNIAGLKGLSDDKAVRLLMGEKVLKLRAPMPEYALSKEDATAVVAYLRSLAPQPSGASTTAAKTPTKK